MSTKAYCLVYPRTIIRVYSITLLIINCCCCFTLLSLHICAQEFSLILLKGNATDDLIRCLSKTKYAGTRLSQNAKSVIVYINANYKFKIDSNHLHQGRPLY